MMNLKAMYDRVRKLEVSRSPSNLNRRAHKGLEEIGELAEAFLNVTSPGNYKVKNWLDVREEAIDVITNLFEVAVTLEGDNLFDPMMAATFPAYPLRYDDHELIDNCIGNAANIFTDILTSPNPSALISRSDILAAVFGMLAIARIDDYPKVEVQRIYDEKLDKWETQLKAGKRTDLVA